MFKKLVISTFLLFPLLYAVEKKEYIFPVFEFNESFYGQNPRGVEPLIYGGYIYGTAHNGGKYSKGVIFRVKKDGSAYEVIHHFEGETPLVHSGNPRGRMVMHNGVIYGVGRGYSDYFGGSVYRINPDGSGFKVILNFYDGTNNNLIGQHPTYGGVTIVGGVLYGTCSRGGSRDNGVIYSVNPDGSNFRLLHDFTIETEQGNSAYNGLAYADGRFYGTTNDGGKYDDGVIYTIKPDGSDFRVIYHVNGPTDGIIYTAALMILDNVIYGTGTEEGPYNAGTIFSIKTDGSDFKVLHSFNTTDGKGPGLSSGFVNIGDYLYGTTGEGGENDKGVLFRIKKDGTGFEVLDHFSVIKGSSRKGTMVYDPPYLFGVTGYGGSVDEGTVFRYYLGYLYSVVTYNPEAGLTTAKLWGNAYKKEDHEILEKGFCWGESSDPDMDDNVEVAGKGEGKFVADIYSLNPGKTYYVRAYVKTAMGTFYGENMSFRSPHPKVSGTVTVDGKPAAGVVVEFPGRETLVTDASGMFSTEVYYGWTGIIKFSKENVEFTKSEYNYSNLKENTSVEVSGTTK